MGLIKAGIGALRGTLADQWKEFFYCDAMDKDVLVTKGKKQVNSHSSCDTLSSQINKATLYKFKSVQKKLNL